MIERQRPFCFLVKGKASIFIPSQLVNVMTRMKQAETDRKKTNSGILVAEFWPKNHIIYE